MTTRCSNWIDRPWQSTAILLPSAKIAASAETLSIVAALRPDVLLLDAQMADDGYGYPDIVHYRRIVVMPRRTMRTISPAPSGGVYGYVLKGRPARHAQHRAAGEQRRERHSKDMFSRLMGMLR